MKIRIKFEDNWLDQYKHKESMMPAYICIEHDEECYPSNDWVDNPAILLGWWLHSMEDLLLGGEGQGFSFMEGPFFIKARIEDENILLVSEDHNITWVINKNEFADELTKSANQASRTFNEIGLNNIAGNLDEGVKKIKAILKMTKKA